jgi:peptidoglycan/LPS O-acetylase OafA/YrhL
VTASGSPAHELVDVPRGTVEIASSPSGARGVDRVGEPTALPLIRPGDNGITALRLVLALAVVVSHDVDLGGFGRQPLAAETPEGLTLGMLAVFGFFGLSGYLLTASRQRTSMGAFLRNRALRIFPGFWVCLVVTAFVIAPLGALITNTSLSVESATHYVIGNSLLDIRVPVIGDWMASNPMPEFVNASLWTLFPEFLCYIGLLLIPLRYLPVAPLGIIIACVASLPIGATAEGVLSTQAIVVAFAAGSLVSSWRVPPTTWPTIAGIAGAIVLLASGHFVLWGIPFLVVATIGLGLAIPLHWRTDTSYGVYIYAYPITQLLVAAGLTRLGLAPFMAVTVAIVIPVAFVSWQFVEAPSLRLKRARPRRAEASVTSRPAA